MDFRAAGTVDLKSCTPITGTRDGILVSKGMLPEEGSSDRMQLSQEK